MTIQVKKSMLKGKYTWEVASDDDSKAAKINARFFNRHSGYNIIRMIQQVVDYFEYQNEGDLARIEELIVSLLPSNIRGWKKVFAWLVEFLSSYVAPRLPIQAAPVPLRVSRVARVRGSTLAWFNRSCLAKCFAECTDVGCISGCVAHC